MSNPYLRGQIDIEGRRYDFGSGGPQKQHIPFGSYPITPEAIGPWGRAHGAIGINNNRMWDAELGRDRNGIEFHAASSDEMLSAGCVAVAGAQWPQFKAHVLDVIRRHGSAVLTVGPDGARVTPGGAQTAAVQAPRANDARDTVAVSNYVVDAARRRGIDPSVALQVYRNEGATGYTGDRGSSHGPFQLHYGGVAPGGNRVAGLGDEFTKKTGLDARDPSTWRQQVDFALDKAKEGGWTPWHGYKGGRWDGISRDAPPAQADPLRPGFVQPRSLSDRLNERPASPPAQSPVFAPAMDLSRAPAAVASRPATRDQIASPMLQPQAATRSWLDMINPLSSAQAAPLPPRAPAASPIRPEDPATGPRGEAAQIAPAGGADGNSYQAVADRLRKIGVVPAPPGEPPGEQTPPRGMMLPQVDVGAVPQGPGNGYQPATPGLAPIGAWSPDTPQPITTPLSTGAADQRLFPEPQPVPDFKDPGPVFNPTPEPAIQMPNAAPAAAPAAEAEGFDLGKLFSGFGEGLGGGGAGAGGAVASDPYAGIKNAPQLYDFPRVGGGLHDQILAQRGQATLSAPPAPVQLSPGFTMRQIGGAALQAPMVEGQAPLATKRLFG